MSDADLDRLAKISADDVDAAAVQFRRDAPRGAATLLDALPRRDDAGDPAITDPTPPGESALERGQRRGG